MVLPNSPQPLPSSCHNSPLPALALLPEVHHLQLDDFGDEDRPTGPESLDVLALRR